MRLCARMLGIGSLLVIVRWVGFVCLGMVVPVVVLAAAAAAVVVVVVVVVEGGAAEDDTASGTVADGGLVGGHIEREVGD
jgi:hypothetical protein